MTAEEWQRLRKEPGMKLYFRLPNGKPVLGTAVGFISRGATISVRETRKDGSEVQNETYWPYQCLYACPNGNLPDWTPPSERGLLEKKCKCCGKNFQTKNDHQKFCSKKCQKRYFSRGREPAMNEAEKSAPFAERAQSKTRRLTLARSSSSAFPNCVKQKRSNPSCSHYNKEKEK